MKKSLHFSLLILTVIGIALINQACSTKKISGNGNITTNTINIGEFNTLSAHGFMNIRLTQGKEGEVKITTDENIQDYIIVENINHHLTIKLKENINVSTKKGVNIDIPFETLSEVSLNGSGDITSKKEVKTKNFKVLLTGSGDLELIVNAKKIDAELTGSGDLELEGETDDLNLKLTGSGDFSGFNLKSKNTNVSIKGSGDAEVYAKKRLIAKVDGTGDIEYKGNPQEKNIQTSGSGDVTQK